MGGAAACEIHAREQSVNCPSCGFVNVAAANFCGGCGEALDGVRRAPPEAERRYVCVLFCDLVGSTPLSHRVDAEVLHDVIGSYQRTCEAVVVRHSGFLAQYRGDSIEVYFGYPQAHEDDASRAVRCALELLDAISQLAAASKLDLQVRIGIDSGRVVVGPLARGGRTERVAIGETPNIAARAQGEAAPGEVVITDSVWRLLPDAFKAQPMGARRLKGVERPVGLFKVVTTAGQPAGLNAPRTPFIGRDSQLQLVRELWGRATSGVPHFVLVRGEPGIGKSRLVEVVRGELVDERTDVLVARCTPVAADTALYPMIELIGFRLGLEGASAEEGVARIANRMTELGIGSKEDVPLLASVLSVPVDPAKWPAPDLSPIRARQRTMDILVEAIHALGRRGPVLLVVEDLHWADPSSIELLHQIIASRQNASLMALLTARPEFTPSWAEATNVAQVELAALDPAESEMFIRKVARDKPPPPEVVWQIRERAGGNPLFLEEITRSVMESGALVEREHAWEIVGTVASEVVPASTEASLMARIDRLGEARPLFQLAATLGREFSHDLLLAVAQLPEDAVRRHLAAMLRSGLVFQHGGASSVYIFKHALVRDAAYDSLLRATRQRYHARIAEVLVGRFPQLVQNRPELLAHHLSGAGIHADAATHWQAAGENAARRSAMKEAVAHFRRALADLGHLPKDAARMERELLVLSASGPARMAVYGWQAAEVGEACKHAIQLARRLGATERMFPPLWGLWTNQFVGGELKEAMETATQLQAMAMASGDPMLVIIGRGASSYTRFYRGEYEQAVAEAQIGLRDCSFDSDFQIAHRFQISAVGSMLITKAGALWMQGRQDEGIALVNDLIAHARALRHPPSTTTILGTVMFFSVYDRDWKRVLAFADEVYDLSRTEGFAMWTANAGLHRGRARIGLGEVDAGMAEVLEWGALFRQTGGNVIEASITSMISEAMHMAGRSEEALAVSSDGEQRVKNGHIGVMVPEIFRTRGDILQDLGRRDAAHEAYRQAVACARAQGARSLEVRALTSLLGMQLSRGQPGDLPSELRRAMDVMVCQPNRPDLLTARSLLARVCN
jgi:class 3 adenylate cyclase